GLGPLQRAGVKRTASHHMPPFGITTFSTDYAISELNSLLKSADSIRCFTNIPQHCRWKVMNRAESGVSERLTPRIWREKHKMATASTDRLRMPVMKHLYQNHVLDSTRWKFVNLRDDDIVVATSYKAGTTWMQAIVGNLIFSGQELPAPISELSPFLEF